MPAVVVSTGQFKQLATAIMRSQRVPESVAIEIKGNPEFISDEALQRVADEVIARVVDKLTREHSTGRV